MNLFQITQRTLLKTAALLVSVVLVQSALADPPGRVARLSEFAGDVQIGHPSSGWRPIQRNYPITAGDNLWVSSGGRAELDVGPVQVWLAGGSSVYFDRFDDQNLNARLTSGSMAVRIRQWESGDAMSVTTEHGEVSFAQPGLYFVSAGMGGNPSVVNARYGQAELNTFGRRQWVSRGESIAFDSRGVLQDRYASAYYSGWVVARDRRISRWESRNRDDANPWMIGVRDLDDHGYWDNTYEYGRVWYPRSVSSSWAPYRYGRWSHVQPWGWTWIDDAPWGFAPFHYGRWVRLGGRWAWSPGSYTGRPVYAPALVTFYGGNGWSISANTGPSYSWVPLGWNEPYAPWYTYTTTHWRHINRPYVRNVTEDPWRPPSYTHASVPGAITAVAAATFLGGRHIAQNHIRTVTEVDVRRAPQARVNEVVPQFVARPEDPNPVVRLPQQQPQRGFDPNAGFARPTIISERAAQPAVVQPNTSVAQPRVWQDPNPVVQRQNVGREIVRGNQSQPQQTIAAPTQPVFPAQPGNGAREVIRVNPPQAAPQLPAQQVQPVRPVQAAPAVQSYPNPQLQQQSAPAAVINRPNPVIEQRAAPEPQPEGPRGKDRLERKPVIEPRNEVAPPARIAPPQPGELRQSKVKEVL
jgi:hypothetical protein